MANRPPDRRFDDSPFSGMPPRRVTRRPATPLHDDPGDPPLRLPRGDSRRTADRSAAPDPDQSRPDRSRQRQDTAGFAARDQTGARPGARPDRETGRFATGDQSSPRGGRAGRPVPPPLRTRGDGYGDTHAELRWDTDRRLRPAYREGRDYLSGPDGDANGNHHPPRRERPVLADPRPRQGAARRGDRDGFRSGPDAAPDHPDRFATGGVPTPGRDGTGRRGGGTARGGDGARAVAAGGNRGPGGRMLAIAGVLFLVVSVVFASVGSIINGNDDAGGANGLDGTEVAAVTQIASDLAVAGHDAGHDGEPLVRFDAAALPTATLPPAGEQEPGYAGPWIDGVRTVCIDPGHGGPDRGRTFDGNETTPALEEAVYTLDHAFALRDRLRARGYVVVMTRTTDSAVDVDGADTNGDGETIADSDRAGTYDEIQARIDVCNLANADLLISLHLNGYDSDTPEGFESWYTADRPFGDQSGVLAQLGVETIAEHYADEGFTPQNRGAKDDGTYSVDDSDPSLAHNMLLTGPAIPGMLTPSNMPGVIMESLFITNQDDIAFLRSANSADIIAGAYADAIDGYFSRFDF